MLTNLHEYYNFNHIGTENTEKNLNKILNPFSRPKDVRGRTRIFFFKSALIRVHPRPLILDSLAQLSTDSERGLHGLPVAKIRVIRVRNPLSVFFASLH